jgi:hypothetical protein
VRELILFLDAPRPAIQAGRIIQCTTKEPVRSWGNPVRGTGIRGRSLPTIYLGLIIGLQALLRGFISQDNNVAIVFSTLVIGALFQPRHQGIQRSIDRRFYRHKYDAARTLADFSATLRQAVDLRQLSEQSVAVVQKSMQPASVSLWLCQSHQGKRAEVPFSFETQRTPSLEGRQSPDALIDGINTLESNGLEKEGYYD